MTTQSRLDSLITAIGADIKALLGRNKVVLLDATSSAGTKTTFYAAQSNGTIVIEYIP